MTELFEAYKFKWLFSEVSSSPPVALSRRYLMAATSSRLRLTMLRLPVIESLDDLASLTHLSKKLLYRLSAYSEYYYKTYPIPKKCGGVRTIAQPSRTLKAVQAWILRNILDHLQVSDVCKGFERGANILWNAHPHRHANAILTIVTCPR